MHSGDLQFSLSGLKTSVMTYLQKEQQAGREINQSDVAASFQAAVIDVQVAKAKTALEQTGAKFFLSWWGDGSKSELRHAYEVMCEEMGVRLTMPPLSACTDNSDDCIGSSRYKAGKFFGLDCDVAAFRWMKSINSGLSGLFINYLIGCFVSFRTWAYQRKV